MTIFLLITVLIKTTEAQRAWSYTEGLFKGKDLCNFTGLKISTVNDHQKLISIKILHTLIWIFFNIVIGYMAYAVVIDKIDKYVWIAIGLVVLEGLVLLIFKYTCPLTLVARNYTNSTSYNFDIFLPNWLARYTKVIYTTIFLVLVVVILIRKNI